MKLLSKGKLYVFFLAVLAVIYLAYGGNQAIIDTGANLGILFFGLGMIFFAVGFFLPNVRDAFKVEGFTGYFNFLLIIGLITIPFMFAANFMGQQTLDITQKNSGATSNVVANTIFNPTYLQAALILGIAVTMLFFILFVFKE